MNRIYKSMLRDIWFSRSRSFAIIIAVTIVIAFPLAFLDLGPNLGAIISDEQEEYNLSHFDVFYSSFANSSAEEKIGQILQSEDAVIQSRTYLRNKILNSSTWFPIDIMLYNKSDQPRVNIPVVTSGRLPETANETTILESYATYMGLSIGDEVHIKSTLSSRNLTIVGLMKSVEFSSYQISQTAAALVTEEGFSFVAALDENSYTDTMVYFREGRTLDELREYREEIVETFRQDESVPDISLFWFSRETSFRKGLQDSLELTSQYMFVAAIFIFAVAGIVIFLVMNRSVTEKKKVIGAMYAFGSSRKRIVLGYMLKITVLTTIGVLTGLLIATILLDFLAHELGLSWGLIEIQSSVSRTNTIITIASAFIISYLSTILAVLNIFRLTPYEAMRGRTTELKNSGLVYSVARRIPLKFLRISIRDMTRSRTRTLLTVIAFTISLTFAWGLLYTENSLNHAVDDYYTDVTNYDLDVDLGLENSFNLGLINEVNNFEGVAESEPFTSLLSAFDDRPEQMMYLNLIRHDTQMFDFSLIEGRWFQEGTNEIVISQYMISNYGVQLGDVITLSVIGQTINGTVVGVMNDMMFTLSMWMDFDEVSPQLVPEGLPSVSIHNHILLKLEPGADPVAVADTINQELGVRIALTKDYYHTRMTTLVNTQAAIIFLMSTLGLVVGSVSVFSTLLISIVEREREIALKRVFGKRRLEIALQILAEGVLMVLTSVIPASYLAKLTTQEIWLGIIASNIFQAEGYYPLPTDIFIGMYALLTGVISVMSSFAIASKIRIVDGIREE